jgi:hypothetical protein
MNNEPGLRAALERILVSVRSAGLHQNDAVLPAYRYCVDLLGYDPSKRDPVVSPASGPGISTTLGSDSSVAPDLFYLLNPEE